VRSISHGLEFLFPLLFNRLRKAHLRYTFESSTIIKFLILKLHEALNCKKKQACWILLIIHCFLCQIVNFYASYSFSLKLLFYVYKNN
jgi:hypothetical protein